jgi:uncharacterized protein
MELRTTHLLSSIILSCGLITAGYFIGKGVENTKLGSRYVTVKGLAEREMSADLAIWPITIKSTGNDLAALNSEAQNNIEIVRSFLLEQGFKKEEFELDGYVVNDLLTSAYRADNIASARYILQATIILKTSNVALAKKASGMQYLLAQKGVIFGSRNDYDSPGPLYILSKFNDLKPEMLSEAIKNARKAAEQFAVDSGIKVGKVRTANQGSFIISPADGSDSYSGGNAEQKTINKKVRVVTTLEYLLE